jgi:hypothetical protein
MSPNPDIIKWLELAASKVKNNVKIVSNEDIDQPYLLHISNNVGIKAFIPVIGHNQGNSEDRTVPRLCVATSLVGCLLGYAKAEWDFIALNPNGTKSQESYRGGMAIYALDFEFALKPNKALVYDAEFTDEHWLVTYSKNTVKYIPEIAGYLFHNSVKFVSTRGNRPIPISEIYFEVLAETGLRFSKNITLGKGYWIVTGNVQANMYGSTDPDPEAWDKDKDFTVTEINKGQYDSMKRAGADLLQYVEKTTVNVSSNPNKPHFTTW